MQFASDRLKGVGCRVIGQQATVHHAKIASVQFELAAFLQRPDAGEGAQVDKALLDRFQRQRLDIILRRGRRRHPEPRR